eukprot:9492052-Pyramimonas_sp.AAC.1
MQHLVVGRTGWDQAWDRGHGVGAHTGGGRGSEHITLRLPAAGRLDNRRRFPPFQLARRSGQTRGADGGLNITA